MSGPRIRPSRPAVQHAADYPELVVVDQDHYAITREIARGGMGRIQVARDRRLGRDVAVKDILVDRGMARRRFEREARLTARLQHPSIVGVYEAGVWPSGEPFYAMPLLSGRSLDEAIELAGSIEKRLALVPNILAIADAMAYAHGKRVIHRDLKPRNVIVGEFGETVVIDWGLAKDLDTAEILASSESSGGGEATGSGATPQSSGRDEGETTIGDVLGTPAYMPPEQAEGLPVDERADVYAIGAILYHLLAGAPPFVASNKTAVVASVIDAPPRPITERVPQAPRELVAIVERAMARDRAKRYPTARELADDLRRFQTGQLVAAHHYTRMQRLRRWIRRHRTAVVATGTASAVALVIGVVAVSRIVSAQQLAEEQRALALANQRSAEGLLQFMLVDLRDKLQDVGKLELLDSVAKRAAEHFDARGPATSDEDLYLSSLARDGIGAVLAKRADLAGARLEHDKARAGFARLAAKHPTERKYALALARIDYAIGALEISNGDLHGALARVRDALGRAKQVFADHPDDAAAARAVYAGHKQSAWIFEDLGDGKAAMAEYRASLAAAAAEVALTDDDDAHGRVMAAHSSMGRVLRNADNDVPGALVEFRKGLAIGERLLAKQPDNPRRIYDVGISHSQIGQALLDQGQGAQALDGFRRSLVNYERVVALDPTNMDWRSAVGGAHEKIGMALFAQKDYAGALAAYRKCREIWVELSQRDPTNTDLQRSVTLAINKLGDVQLATNDATGALATYREALAIRERLVTASPSNAKWRRDRFYSHYKVALALHEIPGRKRDAVAELRTALALADENMTLFPSNGSIQVDAVEARAAVAEALAEVGDRAEARAEYGKALELGRQLAAKGDAKDWATRLARIESKLASLPGK